MRGYLGVPTALWAAVGVFAFLGFRAASGLPAARPPCRELPEKEATARAKAFPSWEQEWRSGEMSIEAWKAIRAALLVYRAGRESDAAPEGYEGCSMDPCFVWWFRYALGEVFWVTVFPSCLPTFGGSVTYIVDEREGYRVIGTVAGR